MEGTQALQEEVALNNANISPENQVKMIPQTEMNAIVKREKEVAAQIARQEAEREYLKKLEALQQQAQKQSQQNSNVSREVDTDALYQQIQEKFNAEMQQRQLQQEMTNVANSYITKIQNGKQQYEDFDEITKDFEPQAFPQLVYLVSGIDNAADVIYELSKNPSKLVMLDALAQRSPKQAQSELSKLSRSIADNRQAQSDAGNQTVAAPLDHLRPSRVSGNNGKPTINDLRSLDYLRG